MLDDTVAENDVKVPGDKENKQAICEQSFTTNEINRQITHRPCPRSAHMHPLMINAGFGRIYNVGSWADIAPLKNSAAYSCSKGGVHALTKAVATDIADLNLDIEVHEWLPGHLKTQMSEYTGIDPSISAGWAVMIANQPQASGKNRIFVHDHEWIPPKRLKNRIKEKLLFWKSTE